MTIVPKDDTVAGNAAVACRGRRDADLDFPLPCHRRHQPLMDMPDRNGDTSPPSLATSFTSELDT